MGPHRDAIDTLIYLDADEVHSVEAWFVARFMALWAEAEHDAASFLRALPEHGPHRRHRIRSFGVGGD